MSLTFKKDIQYYKFCLYGFLKNQRFFEPFYMLFLYEELKVDLVSIGILYAVREIVKNVFEIPSGMLADAFGRRATMMGAFALYSLSFILYFFSTEFTMLVIACAVFGAADAFRTGTHKAMIFQYLKIKGWENQKVHYYGHTRSWSQFGTAVSSLIAAVLVFRSGNYSSIFLYSLVPYTLDFLLMASYPKVLEGESLNRPNQNFLFVFNKIIREFILSFKNIQLFKAITNMSAYSGYYQAVKDYLQLVIRTFALSTSVFVFLEQKKRIIVLMGIFYFFLNLSTMLAARNSGKISDKFRHLSRPINLTLIAGLLAGILLGIFYKIGLPLISVLLFFIIYILENLRRPMAVSYVTEQLNDNILASVLSAESQANTVFAAIIAVLLGFFADKFGIETGFIIISSLLLLLSPFYLIGKSGMKDSVSHGN